MTRHFDKRLSSSLASFGGWLLLTNSTPAWAQTIPPAEPAADEIVVTATRRSQDVQSVPIAMSAFSGETIRALGITRTEDLARQVAGAQVFDDRGAGQPAWVIRGVGLADYNANNTPTAAIYFDDVYLPSNVMGSVATFDIDGVEVLKGPQGGLYGRDTTGGAVLIKSRKPKLGEFGGNLAVNYGRWGQWGGEAAINAPLGETAALRVSGRIDRGGGWQDSLATPGNDRHGKLDRWGLRGQLRFEPGSRLALLFKLDAGEDHSEATLAQELGVYDPATGSFCAAVAAGRHDDPGCVGFSNITNAFVRTPGDPGLLTSLQDRAGRRTLSNPINRLDNNWQDVSLRATLDLGGADLISNSSWMRYRNRQFNDYDGSPLFLLEEAPGETLIRSWSQELRLVSQGDRRFDWLLGAIYAHDSLDDARIGSLEDNELALGAFFPPPFRSSRAFRQKTESWALYGQASYAFAPQWELGGSLRYTATNRDLIGYSHSFGNPGAGFFILENISKQYHLRAHWAGHIGLTWKPAADVMIYATATRGFKSGGFFGGFALDQQELDPYREETVWSYEAGFKTRPFAGLTFNGAAFYYDYNDTQGFLTLFNPVLQRPITQLGNIGDGRHIGAEGEMNWTVTSHFTLQASAAWLDAKITRSNATETTQDSQLVGFVGRHRTFAPKFSYNLMARYARPIGALDASVQLGWSWRSALVTREAVGSNVDYGLLRHDGYGLANLNLTIGQRSRGWEAALTIDNLFDKAYDLRVTNNDVGSFIRYPGRPRSWRLELRQSF